MHFRYKQLAKKQNSIGSIPLTNHYFMSGIKKNSL